MGGRGGGGGSGGKGAAGKGASVAGKAAGALAQAAGGQGKTLDEIIAQAQGGGGTSLEDALRATKGQLDRGVSLAQMNAPKVAIGKFASIVNTAARAVPASGRYGENKVFISEAFKAARSSQPSLSMSEFKDRLVQANREGLVRLSRADLISAMDPKLVSASETDAKGATFHFILTR